MGEPLHSHSLFRLYSGDKVFIDFTGKKLSIIDPSIGEVQYLEIFVTVMGFSGLIYIILPGIRSAV